MSAEAEVAKVAATEAVAGDNSNVAAPVSVDGEAGAAVWEETGSSSSSKVYSDRSSRQIKKQQISNTYGHMESNESRDRAIVAYT